MNLFPDRKWVRLKEYDYNQPGAYFVTLVTYKRQEIFGKIVNDQMYLSSAGSCADVCWRMIPSHFNNVVSDVFIVMPNHVHGIIEIEGDDIDKTITPSLSDIVSSYKSAVSKLIHRMAEYEMLKVWQRSFYDHIIRDDRDYDNIVEYINGNPVEWALDKENMSSKRNLNKDDAQF